MINNEDTYDQSDDGVEISTYNQCDQGNDTENYPPETIVISSSDEDLRWTTVVHVAKYSHLLVVCILSIFHVV